MVSSALQLVSSGICVLLQKKNILTRFESPMLVKEL